MYDARARHEVDGREPDEHAPDDEREPDDEQESAMRAALITISTSKAAGVGQDESGARLAELASRLSAEIVARELIPDERSTIEERLRHWSERGRCELVLTSGGTGLSPSDVTPEATSAVIERDAPGISEAIRLASQPHTPFWMLSRGVAGVRGATLIVNFPGSPRSIEEVADALLPALAHAVALIAGANGGSHTSI
ncbi:MAG: MogA/MoaB family molybdenum cofactor biosynthesis protein [Solirubrobacteraceae bacterium]